MDCIRLHTRRLGPSLSAQFILTDFCIVGLSLLTRQASYSFLSKSLGISNLSLPSQMANHIQFLEEIQLLNCVCLPKAKDTISPFFFFREKLGSGKLSSYSNVRKSQLFGFFYSQLSKIEPNNSMFLSMSQATCLATWLQRQERPTRSLQFSQSYTLFVLLATRENVY